jgi:hypothetical protein
MHEELDKLLMKGDEMLKEVDALASKYPDLIPRNP